MSLDCGTAMAILRHAREDVFFIFVIIDFRVARRGGMTNRSRDCTQAYQSRAFDRFYVCILKKLRFNVVASLVLLLLFNCCILLDFCVCQLSQ